MPITIGWVLRGASHTAPAAVLVAPGLGISVVGFLGVYLLHGAPEGPLRRVAIVDALALLPLGLVTLAAWRS